MKPLDSGLNTSLVTQLKRARPLDADLRAPPSPGLPGRIVVRPDDPYAKAIDGLADAFVSLHAAGKLIQEGVERTRNGEVLKGVGGAVAGAVVYGILATAAVVEAIGIPPADIATRGARLLLGKTPTQASG